MNEGFYQQAILDLSRDDTHAGRLDAPDKTATRDNPLCGDRVSIDIAMADNQTIKAVAHEVKGCALCKASAALAAQTAEGATKQDVEKLKTDLESLLSGGVGSNDRLAIFSLVRQHKSRHDCLRLPLDTLLDALKD